MNTNTSNKPRRERQLGFAKSAGKKRAAGILLVLAILVVIGGLAFRARTAPAPLDAPDSPNRVESAYAVDKVPVPVHPAAEELPLSPAVVDALSSKPARQETKDDTAKAPILPSQDPQSKAAPGPAIPKSVVAALTADAPPAQPAPPTTPPLPLDAQVKSIIELQPYSETQTLQNARGDCVTLINLNKYIGVYYLLDAKFGGQETKLHLELPAVLGDATAQTKLVLSSDGLTIVGGPQRHSQQFALWSNTPSASPSLQAAANTTNAQLIDAPAWIDAVQPALHAGSAFTSICDGQVLVRTQKTGTATTLESATDMLRNVPLGDWFIEKMKPHLIPNPDTATDQSMLVTQPEEAAGPRAAALDAAHTDAGCVPTSLGIANDAPNHHMTYGRWYRATNQPGMFVSVMKVSAGDKKLLDTYKERVSNVGQQSSSESDALVYSVAFDLNAFRFGFKLGAEHPHIEWSPKATVPHKGGGPDGFDSRAPLVTIGGLPPYEKRYVAATFCGGFKRQHGVFSQGELGKTNNGSHFGFVEKGVTFSRLMPGLATACIRRDGMIDLFTWPKDAVAMPTYVMDARQNCVAIIEGIDANGISIPGALVNKWGDGAWSGSQAGNFLTTRSGLAIQESGGKPYLINSYFTGATPNAMARVYQAYNCRYAMLLDMNSISYCYVALYQRDDQGQITGAEYLHKDMASANGAHGSLRFVQTNDTRDFFYVLREPDTTRVSRR